MSIIKSIQLGMFILGLSVLGQHAAGTEPPILAFAGLEALLPETPSSDLGSYAGHATLIVIFADTPDDAEFTAQLDILRPHAEVLADLNVVLLTDTSPLGKRTTTTGIAATRVSLAPDQLRGHADPAAGKRDRCSKTDPPNRPNAIAPVIPVTCPPEVRSI